jgi:Na+:H+ antiporter, NhaA family
MSQRPTRPIRRLLTRASTWAEAQQVADALRTETVGGVLLLLAATTALLWANSPWRAGYAAMRETTFGPTALHLHLNLAQWAADGLLAVFFFVAGLELKRELVVGDLRDPARAVLPVVAALVGVLVPAAIYLALTLDAGPAVRGWAVPTATDIAFALAALAVIGSHLPSALRSFLLTLAVVDDLLAITIIAVFYTADLALVLLLLAGIALAGFGALIRRRTHRWMAVAPAVLTWGLVHASGVHATVAGVLLALTVPVRPRCGGSVSVAQHLEHRIRPFSAAVAVPVFALLAAGVTLVGGGLGAALGDPASVAVVVALVCGKPIGVLGATWATARFTRAELDDDLAWADVLGVSLLAGIGFTVSLLIGDLAFGAGSARDDHVKAAVLVGSLLSALLAAVVLRRRERHYRRIAQDESRDDDGDGVPDVYQRPPGA